MNTLTVIITILFYVKHTTISSYVKHLPAPDIDTILDLELWHLLSTRLPHKITTSGSDSVGLWWSPGMYVCTYAFRYTCIYMCV